MDDQIQQDIDDAAAHQQELEVRRQEADGWQWWTSYHKALCERRKAERESIEATNRAMREWLDAR